MNEDPIGQITISLASIPVGDLSLARIMQGVDTMHIYKEPDGSLVFRAFTGRGGESIVVTSARSQEWIRFALAKLNNSIDNA